MLCSCWCLKGHEPNSTDHNSILLLLRVRVMTEPITEQNWFLWVGLGIRVLCVVVCVCVCVCLCVCFCVCVFCYVCVWCAVVMCVYCVWCPYCVLSPRVCIA